MSRDKLHAEAYLTAIADTGCELEPSCLSCSLPMCKHDVGTGHGHHVFKAERNAEIVKLRGKGWTIEQLMERFQVGQRTITRAMQKGA